MKKRIFVVFMCFFVLGGAANTQGGGVTASSNSSVEEVDAKLTELTDKAWNQINVLSTIMDVGEYLDGFAAVEAYRIHIEELVITLRDATEAGMDMWQWEVFVVDQLKDQQVEIRSLWNKNGVPVELKEGFEQALGATYRLMREMSPEAPAKAKQAKDDGEAKLEEAKMLAEKMIKKARDKAEEKARMEVEEILKIVDEVAEWADVN